MKVSVGDVVGTPRKRTGVRDDDPVRRSCRCLRPWPAGTLTWARWLWGTTPPHSAAAVCSEVKAPGCAASTAALAWRR